MRNLFSILMILVIATVAKADFPESLQFDNYPWYPNKIHLTSKLKMEPIFVGGVDMVKTTDTYGNAAGEAPAKQWHDFIGFTPAVAGETGIGWVSVNHEMTVSDDMIGDGGGMTCFQIDYDADSDRIIVMDQTLEDGRQGKFFNVDFVNTVGETGMNCGGIVSEVDGRIWTAEEWQRRSNEQISSFDRDTTDFTIGYGWEGTEYEGKSIQKYENYNYMVEIDPRQAKPVRKQYNWGRQWFEGGVVLPDNRTIILGVDASPAYLMKFEADTPGDFTTGTLYLYVQDANSFTGTWQEVSSGATGDDTFLSIQEQGEAIGANTFMRLEWVAYDKNTGKVYMAETGRDDAGNRFSGSENPVAYHHVMRAQEKGVDAKSENYVDYYGRVIVLDLEDNSIKSFLEGGPDYPDLGDDWQNTDYTPYPETHLSNPDGLTVMYIQNKSYLVVQEDLNGSSYGRVHPGLTNRNCEFFLLPLEGKDMATPDDLIRLGMVAVGAEVTGARPVYDPSDMNNAVALLVNSQHPRSFNEAPFDNSLTVAITGWADAITDIVENGGLVDENNVKVYPNPTATSLFFKEIQDAALYNMDGQRIRVSRGVREMYVGDLAPGAYFLKFDQDPKLQKVIIER